MKHVGQRVRGIDWPQRTSGTLAYTADLKPEGMLYGAMLRSPHSLARIRSINIAKALAMPGVHAVATAQDLPPGTRYIHEGAADRAPLADGMARFVGQEVAAVAAETVEQLQAALLAIEVDYEAIDAPHDITASRKAGAATLHERTTGEANVSKITERDWGDTQAGIRASTITVGGRYHFPRQHHACLETNGCLAQWDAAAQMLHYWSSTQAPYYIVMEVSKALGLDKNQVVCHEVGVGGGFGSKSKICDHEVVAGVLARKSGRPVRLMFSREEEFESTRTRHAFTVDMQLHADATGCLQAITASFDVDNGAYNHSGVSVMSASIKAVGMLYRPQGVRVTARLIDTATIPGASFRGYGSTQTSFALEGLMDVLAERLQMDPIELRRRNANQQGETTLVGAHLGSARLVECLDAVQGAIGWQNERVNQKANRHAGRGVGIAAGVHVSGSYTGPGANRSDATVDVYADGRVRVRFGGSDAGTGQRTLIAQIVAEELGVELAAVDVLTMDSALAPFDMGAWSSRGTHYGGHAARTAAVATAARLKTIAAPHLGAGVDDLALKDGYVQRTNGEACRMSIGDVALLDVAFKDGMLTVETSYVEDRVVLPDPKTGQGNVSPSYNFACHGALVQVDRKTGHVALLDYVAAHDIGTAINPIALEGQAIGGAVMGIGAALGEEVVFEQGKLVNPSFLHYAVPRAGDVPTVRPLMIEGGDPMGPYGAKAIGECGINPPPSAIVNAIHDAIGVRFTSLPVTPDKVINALAAQEGRTRTFNIWRRPSRWWISIVRAAYPLGLLQILHKRTKRFPSRMQPVALRKVETPEALADLIALKDEHALFLGGGTDLQVQRRQGLVDPQRMLWTGGVAELKTIEPRADGTVRVGGAVTLAALAEAMRSRTPVLAQAIDTIASAQIREMATVAGNLVQAKRCWFYRSGFGCYKRLGGAAPCYAIEGDHRFYHAAIDGHRCQATTPSDLATVLNALDATAVLRTSHGERHVPVSEFFTGPGETVLQPDELLAAIELPAASATQAGQFHKLRLWEGDFAVASVAMVGARVVLGGVAPTPWRARETERQMAAGGVNDVATLRQVLDGELNRHAHPLARNGWKLDAVAGLAERAYEAMNES